MFREKQTKNTPNPKRKRTNVFLKRYQSLPLLKSLLIGVNYKFLFVCVFVWFGLVFIGFVWLGWRVVFELSVG